MPGLQDTSRGILQTQINRCTSNVNPSGIEQADALDVSARKERAEGATEHIARAEQRHELDAGRVGEAAGRPLKQPAIQYEPDRDVDDADQAQQAPPLGHGI